MTDMYLEEVHYMGDQSETPPFLGVTETKETGMPIQAERIRTSTWIEIKIGRETEIGIGIAIVTRRENELSTEIAIRTETGTGKENVSGIRTEIMTAIESEIGTGTGIGIGIATASVKEIEIETETETEIGDDIRMATETGIGTETEIGGIDLEMVNERSIIRAMWRLIAICLVSQEAMIVIVSEMPNEGNLFGIGHLSGKGRGIGRGVGVQAGHEGVNFL